MGKKEHSQYISEKCRMILEKDEGCQDLAEKENKVKISLPERHT